MAEALTRFAQKQQGFRSNGTEDFTTWLPTPKTSAILGERTVQPLLVPTLGRLNPSQGDFVCFPKWEAPPPKQALVFFEKHPYPTLFELRQGGFLFLASFQRRQLAYR